MTKILTTAMITTRSVLLSISFAMKKEWIFLSIQTNWIRTKMKSHSRNVSLVLNFLISHISAAVSLGDFIKKFKLGIILQTLLDSCARLNLTPSSTGFTYDKLSFNIEVSQYFSVLRHEVQLPLGNRYRVRLTVQHISLNVTSSTYSIWKYYSWDKPFSTKPFCVTQPDHVLMVLFVCVVFSGSGSRKFDVRLHYLGLSLK